MAVLQYVGDPRNGQYLPKNKYQKTKALLLYIIHNRIGHTADRCNDKVNQNANQKNRQGRFLQPAPNNTLTCFTCDVHGHASPACPNREVPRATCYKPRVLAVIACQVVKQRNQGRPTCGYCGLAYHHENECVKMLADRRPSGQSAVINLFNQTTILKSRVQYFNDTTGQLQKQQLSLEQNMKKIAEAVEKLQGKVQRIEQRLMLPHSLNEVLQYSQYLNDQIRNSCHTSKVEIPTTIMVRTLGRECMDILVAKPHHRDGNGFQGKLPTLYSILLDLGRGWSIPEITQITTGTTRGQQ